MSKDELSIWFYEKFDSCYPVILKKYTDSIFWCYDENFIRKSKLLKLYNQEVIFPTEIKGVCLFEQVEKDKEFFCQHNEIWNFFDYNFPNDYKYPYVQSIIKSVMNERMMLKEYKPYWRHLRTI